MMATVNRLSGTDDGLGDYLRLLRRIPLLTPAEELHLGATVQEWLSHPDPPVALRRSGARARNRMVSANLRLVVLICRHYRDRIGNLQLEMLDLLQAGNLGLIRAVEKFDPSRGYKFSTYAFWWIRQSVKRYMNEVGSGIRIPMPLLSLAYRAQRLQAGSESPLSSEAMAERLGEDEQRLERSLRIVAQCRPVSLDRPVGGEGDHTCLVDLIGDEHGLRLDDDYHWLHEHVEALEPREQQLIRLRYGPQERRSFSEAARIMGLTKSYAQSLERRALRKLRHRLAPVLDPPRTA